MKGEPLVGALKETNQGRGGLVLLNHHLEILPQVECGKKLPAKEDKRVWIDGLRY